MRKIGDFSIGSKIWPGTSKLIEECGEILQVLGKLIGSSGEIMHWDGTDLREKLVEELADVGAALAFFMQRNMTPEEIRRINARVKEKYATFERWHANPVDLPMIRVCIDEDELKEQK